MNQRRRKHTLVARALYWNRILPFRPYTWYGTVKLRTGQIGAYEGFRIIESPLMAPTSTPKTVL